MQIDDWVRVSCRRCGFLFTQFRVHCALFAADIEAGYCSFECPGQHFTRCVYNGSIEWPTCVIAIRTEIPYLLSN